ncbi:MAG: DUF421 domain-containing protein [Clostridia bacterium]|nr:DUF421 domain-containing protein [Clostridia bacterium]
MAVTIIRAVILYAVIILMIRLMGKRQIAQLQPSELVITILISEIASTPIQDANTPIATSLAALFVLVSFEVLTSAAGLKSNKLRSLMQGHSVIVVRAGEIQMKELKKLRMTVGDLISALRQKDVFDISQVDYAVFETNGQISVLLKAEHKNATAGDMNISVKNSGMPFAVICDGKIIEETVSQSGIDIKKIEKAVKKSRIPKNEILLMTICPDGTSFFARKENEE